MGNGNILKEIQIICNELNEQNPNASLKSFGLDLELGLRSIDWCPCASYGDRLSTQQAEEGGLPTALKPPSPRPYTEQRSPHGLGRTS